MIEQLEGLFPAQPGRPAGEDLVARRAEIEGLGAIQIVDPAAAVSERTIAGVRCLEVSASRPKLSLLYLHGGGFRLGRPETWLGLASRLTAQAPVRVVLPDYTLAPEAPFPAALVEAARVYGALVEEGTGSPALAGDSAGGGLTASLALATGMFGASRPKALALLSPWLDLRIVARSYDACAASDRMFSRAAAIEAAAQYLGDTPRHHSLVSPLLGDPAGLPPTWICASASEVLRDDAVGFAARLAEAKVLVELVVEPELPHVWPLVQPGSIETRHTIEALGTFLRRCAD